jgi:hypothetical protein
MDVIENGHRGGENAALARLDEAIESLFVPLANPPDQLRFAGI